MFANFVTVCSGLTRLRIVDAHDRVLVRARHGLRSRLEKSPCYSRAEHAERKEGRAGLSGRSDREICLFMRSTCRALLRRYDTE